MRRGLGLKLASGAVLLFLYFPLAIIMLYAFTTEASSFKFPPPGLTFRWFEVASQNTSIGSALRLSLTVGLISSSIALVLGSLLGAAVSRRPFFGRDSLSLLVLLPI